MWRLLLLSLLAVAVAAAQGKQPEDLLDDGDDMDLNEEELRALTGEDEDEATVIDDEEYGEKSEKGPGETETDSSVSFQVGIGSGVEWTRGVSDLNRMSFNGFKVTYKTPVPTGEVYFAETFDDGSLDRCGLAVSQRCWKTLEV